MKDKKETLLLILSLGISGTLLIVFLVGRLQLKRQGEERKKVEEQKEEITKMEEVSPEISTTPTIAVPPTLTKEEIEIVVNIETYEVKITTNGFEPASLTIKTHDQVDWINELGEAYNIKGGDWGGLELDPEERFTQNFEKPGVYPYSCELHPEMTGEIIVKE